MSFRNTLLKVVDYLARSDPYYCLYAAEEPDARNNAEPDKPDD
ncbi:Hypothetical protein DEACI_3854 [Acididesulfobacillus acetoxydans]|uniref:Uncharacterized protein n=1 Tax=Acididesulfobacillus acetoxydans TaxID=1561005 RepID=A0A8S0X1B2_9FIRM|nr:hypothetical protein [Acididesulfobacillus acetoxydans]CAA7603031.1 Hypothetical protein DEACI_3854 [Acididesulfobacillus acetoxydans]CEJ08990.1 Hypothetical protein DEACI_3472 [Acididesulfobacillus acetoxydans]